MPKAEFLQFELVVREPPRRPQSSSLPLNNTTPILSALLTNTDTMLATRLATRSARVAAPRIAYAPIRTYAEAKGAVDSKPPVQVFGLDGTYATALVCQKHQQHSSFESLI